MLIPHLEPITVFPLFELNYIALTLPHPVFYHPGIQYCSSQFTVTVSATNFTTSPSTPLSTLFPNTQNKTALIACFQWSCYHLSVTGYLPSSSWEPRTGQGLPDVSHQCWAKGHHHLPEPAHNTHPRTAQEAPPQVQGSALLFVELHEVPLCSLLQSIQAPARGCTTTGPTKHSSQFCTAYKLLRVCSVPSTMNVHLVALYWKSSSTPGSHCWWLVPSWTLCCWSQLFEPGSSSSFQSISLSICPVCTSITLLMRMLQVTLPLP